MRKLTPCGVLRISSDGDESKDFLGFEISDSGIFWGMAGRPRDFLVSFFFFFCLIQSSPSLEIWSTPLGS